MNFTHDFPRLEEISTPNAAFLSNDEKLKGEYLYSSQCELCFRATCGIIDRYDVIGINCNNDPRNNYLKIITLFRNNISVFLKKVTFLFLTFARITWCVGCDRYYHEADRVNFCLLFSHGFIRKRKDATHEKDRNTPVSHGTGCFCAGRKGP